MADLLSSLDVVNKAFKKSMRGYDPADVDEFLDVVAESIQAYVQKIKDYERTVEEQSEKLRDFENIKSSLHEALLMAQKTAEEKLYNASRSADEKIAHASAQAETILAEAKLKAERMINEAESSVSSLGQDLKGLQEIKSTGIDGLRAFIGDIVKVLDNADHEQISIPEFAKNIMKRSEEAQTVTTATTPVSGMEDPQEVSAQGDDAAKKQEINNTLSALGIDPHLLNVDA